MECDIFDIVGLKFVSSVESEIGKHEIFMYHFFITCFKFLFNWTYYLITTLPEFLVVDVKSQKEVVWYESFNKGNGVIVNFSWNVENFVGRSWEE